jgi:hypothetical protein
VRIGIKNGVEMIFLIKIKSILMNNIIAINYFTANLHYRYGVHNDNNSLFYILILHSASIQ